MWYLVLTLLRSWIRLPCLVHKSHLIYHKGMSVEVYLNIHPLVQCMEVIGITPR